MKATLQFLAVLLVGSVHLSSLAALGSTCPAISEYCKCRQPQHLTCKGPSKALGEIIDGLESRNVSDDQVSSLVGLELKLSNLSTLKASFFDASLTQKLPMVKNISTLSILNGRVSQVEDGAFTGVLGTLRALFLANNSLHEIPETLTRFKVLEHLDLSMNFIRNLQILGIGGQQSERQSPLWKSLTYLDLSHNSMSNITGDEYLPRDLETLSLKHNDLSLSDLRNIRLNPSLDKLDVSFNDLNGTLTKSAFNPYSASSYNSCNLTSLNLSNNKIRQIGRDPFFKVPNLEYLNLAGNQIDKLNLLAFTTLTKLTQLDLSKNRILDIPLGVFEALANLSHLDLSYNSLSVLDAGTTFGLARLSYLDLKSNDIIRINASSLAFCHSLTTLTLSDNPLDCSSCKLADFQKWLKNSIQLDLHSKQAAKCRTPTKFSNAVINDIADFECTAAGDLVIDPTTDYPAVATDLETRVSAADQDREAFNRVAGMADMSQNTTLVLRSETFNDVKHIAKFSLLPSGELKSFSCHQIKAYCRGQQVFNQSVSCDGGTVTLDTSLVGQCGPDRKPEETMVCVEAKDTSATAAADSELIEACGSMFMTAIDYEEKLVKSLKASLHTQSKALTAAFETVSPPSFYKDKSHLRKCVTKVQVIDKEKVKDDGDVVKQILHNCKTSENVRFEGIGGIHYGIHHGHLQVCVYHVLTYSQEIDTRQTCSDVLETMKDPAPIVNADASDAAGVLPLALTLVFLCVGIVALTILYLVFKGCLRDRRDGLSLTGTSAGFHSVNSNPFNNGDATSSSRANFCAGLTSFQRSLWYLCPLSFLKGRRRHGPYSDELFLDDDDNCTEMSQVGT